MSCTKYDAYAPVEAIVCLGRKQCATVDVRAKFEMKRPVFYQNALDDIVNRLKV